MSLLKQTRHYFVRVKQSYFPKKLSTAEIEYAKNHLPTELSAIFFEQPLCDQRHGFLVFDKCKIVFDGNTIDDDELFLTCSLHDLAKTQSYSSVTMRIFVALILSVLKPHQINNLTNSRYIFFKKMGIYANHSELSANIISQYSDSLFAYEATKYHHSPVAVIDEQCQYADQVKCFIDADTL